MSDDLFDDDIGVKASLQNIETSLKEVVEHLRFFRDRYCAAKGESRAVEADPSTPKCPKCDGPMVKRNSYKGPFWGCQNYPNCKGTRDLTPEEKVNTKPPF